MTNYVSNYQDSSSHMIIVILTAEAVQAQVTKMYMVAECMR